MTPAGVDSADDFNDDPTRVVVAETPSRRADAGIAWGSLVHGLLEHVMRYPSATREDLRRLGLWLTVDDPPLRILVEQAVYTAQVVAASDQLRDARLSSERHEEVPFAIVENAGAADGVPTVVNGTIDLVYRAGSVWRIVDYKTDADSAAASLETKYVEQVAAYARAWSVIAPGPIETEIVAARVGDHDRRVQGGL
jgi:ATP-dependent exoDNAse (exonuclease V) beta subunit